MIAPTAFQVRRATTDDLQQLAPLWDAARFAVEDLEKRFTEFQVALNYQGEIVGAVGMLLIGGDGLIHSETFADFALSDAVRPLLWERLQVLARSHNLFRLWTAETAPFWKKDAGFSVASEEVLARLPEQFGQRRAGWLALRLKDESADPSVLDAQFAVFREAEQAKRERLLARAHAVKLIVTVLAALLFIFTFVVLIEFERRRR